MRILTFLLLTCSVAVAQEPKLEEPEKPKVIVRAEEAVAAAVAHCDAIAAIDSKAPLFGKYIWDNVPTSKTIAEISLAANTAFLQDSEPVRCIQVIPGVYYLNLAEYVDYDEKSLRLLLDTWERMDDRQLYQPTDEFKYVSSKRWFYTGPDKKFNNKWLTKVAVRVFKPHAYADVDGQLQKLALLSQSSIPIISKGQFLRFTLNSEFGGLYPEFNQIEINPEKGTAEEAFLAEVGIDLKKLGEVNADQRVVCIRKPTAGPGIIEYMAALGTRSSKGPVIATITRDFFAGPIDDNRHPLENLLDRKHDGTEIFIPNPAGGLRFGLFDAKGKFVRSAPVNPPKTLATDRTVPNGFQPILQIPSSCIRCHIYDNPDTKVYGIYQYAPNYVQYLRNIEIKGENGQLLKFDVFADQSFAINEQAKKRLVTLFNGDTSDAFTYAGRTYSNFVLEASGLPLEEAVGAMMGAHDKWLYEWKRPKDILLIHGYHTETNEQAVELFNKICPPAPEPLRVSQIRAWTAKQDIKIPIDDVLASYGEIALRIRVQEQKLKAVPPN